MNSNSQNEWVDRDIGRLIKTLSGFPFPSSLFSNCEGYPLIRIRDILDSSIETYYSGRPIEQFVIKDGDILVGMDGDFNIRRWKNESALLNQRILKIDTKNTDELDLDFLFFWLQPYLKKVNDVTAATTVKHLSVSDIYRATGKLPRVSVQKKIARILQTVDEAIEKTEALIEKYSQIKAGMMQDLFTRGLTPDGKLRPPRSEAPELYQETPIGWIPKEWTPMPLGSLSDIVRGSTPRPAKDPKYFDGNFIPWITVGELSKDNWPYLNGTRTMLTEKGAMYSRKLNSGTLIISNSGYGCGVPKILKLDGCANDGIAAFLNLSDMCNQLYVYYYLYSQIDYLRTKVARGNDQPNLNTDMLGEFSIPVPEIAEQKAISDRLWSIEVLLSDEKRTLEKFGLQKSGLMHDLLTGKRPVKLDDPEPADV